MKKNTIPAIFFICFLGFISCEQEDSEPTIQKPVAELEITKLDGGSYLLDASLSEHALEIKWESSGIIESPIWEEFESKNTKTITVPDTTEDYTVKVSVRNKDGENSKSSTLEGTPIVIKYSNFANIDEMLANPYIAAAVEANNLEINYGSSPADLTGTYEVITKENHMVQIDGVEEEYQESELGDHGYGGVWRPFLCKLAEDNIRSIYLSGESYRDVVYNIQGEGNNFTIYLQNELNPWYTKLRALWDDEIYIDEGVHIISGTINEDNSVTLKCLWIRVWENESTSGTGNWSYCELTLEEERVYPETFTDTRDGKVYKIVKIGNQTWFAETLAYEPKEEDGYLDYHLWEVGIENDGEDKFYGSVFESELSIRLTGYAYTWKAATGLNVGETVPTGEVVQGICPEGWHIPTAEEWAELVNYLGGTSVAGKKLQSRIWKTEEWAGSNESGFNLGYVTHILGTDLQEYGYYDAGFAQIAGEFLTIGTNGEMNYVFTFGDETSLSSPIPSNPNYNGENDGFAIRCIKD